MQNETLNTFTLEKKPGSLVVITGEIPFTELEQHRSAALRALGNNLDLDGFRKGHVPEAVVAKTVGDMAILSEMAERTLRAYYPRIVETKSLDVIGYPQIALTKLASGNPLGFTITVAVVPEVTLPDYEKLAKGINKEKESKEVTDEEVTTQINEILRQKVAYERLQKKAQHTHAEGEACADCEAEAPIEDTKDEVKEVNVEDREGALGHIPLPELTDEYVKTFGKEGQFTSVEDFRTKIKEHLTIQKAQDVDSRHRAKLTDAIIEKSEIDIPKVLVDAEIGQMFAQMEDDLTRAQLKMDDYLTHVKKTKEDLIAEWTPSATKRAKLQLVLNAIAKKDSIIPDPSLVDHEVSHLLERYKDADEKRVRTYVSSVLQNDAVMKKLEEAK